MCLQLLLGWLFVGGANGSEIGPASDSSQSITLAADYCTRWQQGVYEVFHLKGNCYLNQGLTYARGPEGVVWIDRTANPAKVHAYFEGSPVAEVTVDYRGDNAADAGGRIGRESASTWFHRFQTVAPLRMRLPEPGEPPAEKPEVYERGLARFNPEHHRQMQLAQFSEVLPAPDGHAGLPPGVRRIQSFSRNGTSFQVEFKNLPDGQTAGIVTDGVRLLIDGLANPGIPGMGPQLGTVDISTDRAVIWTSGITGDISGVGVQSQDAPLEIYMEGNIEFRQGDRVIYADRMFYDARRQVGVVLNAELLLPLPPSEEFDYQGVVRLRAAAVRQLDQSRFSATDALLTTSRLEEPGYAITSSEINFQDVPQSVVDPLTGAPLFDPVTGEPVTTRTQLATSRGNVLRARGLPLFYWPRFTTDLQDPTFLIDSVRVGSDDIFGTQIETDLDAYQLFGFDNRLEGTEWQVSLDYLSDRGIGHGTSLQYDRSQLFGYGGGPAYGFIDFWGIFDDGLDNLGLGRANIVPEEDYRFRLFGNHRQILGRGWELTGEVNYLSDRTFLEQFYEQEWDTNKDQRNGLRLKRLVDNRALSIEANGQANQFFTDTQWLPRADHYWLGESLLGDRITWYEHSQAGYANLNVATVPTEPTLASQFTTLPGEANVDGERLVTRQELDLPLQLGPVKAVVFGLGELAQWGEDLTGNELQRAYVHTGVRASLPAGAVFPQVRDPLFNLNGLAHKIVFDAEFSYADADEDFTDLPLYDPLDDTNLNEFLRRVQDPTLDPTVTGFRFDRRNRLFRSGIQGWVTSPTTEIADDLMALRGGMRNRWQTKRGAPGRQHIVDWLTIDVNGTYFPKADRDNFGEDFGLVDYDLRWNVGDRLTVVSNGDADFFSDGLRTVYGGVEINRPSRGNGMIGIRSIEGPISSTVALASYNYRISEKWITSAGFAVDFGVAGNIGQNIAFTRIGESFITSLGVNIDESKDNVGFRFLIEPRALPDLRVTKTTGIEVPPEGVFGIW